MQNLINKIKGKWIQFSTSEKGKQIINRVKSFVWRFGAYIVVAAIAYFTSKVLPTLQLSPEFVAFIAYICGEITKYLNTNV